MTVPSKSSTVQDIRPRMITLEAVVSYMKLEVLNVFNECKCGEGRWSVVPTVVWLLGVAGLAKRTLDMIFKRFIFRRVPIWESVLQDLLFGWIMFYGLYVWKIKVRLIKMLVLNVFGISDIDMDAESSGMDSVEDVPDLLYTHHQMAAICLASLLPTLAYVVTRPRNIYPQPMMVWITTNPWQRREMGPYGYYLNRPLSMTPSLAVADPPTKVLRGCFSDSDVKIKMVVRRKRHSKSC